MRAYEDLLPGAAERLLALAERRQAHRHERETEERRHAHRMDRRALSLGAALSLAGLLAAVLSLGAIVWAGLQLVSAGHDAAGFAAILTAAAGIIAAFAGAYFRRPETPER